MQSASAPQTDGSQVLSAPSSGTMWVKTQNSPSAHSPMASEGISISSPSSSASSSS